MGGMSAPVVLYSRDGHLVASGPAATIRPALKGASPLTLDGGEFTGDVVTLRGLQLWRDGASTVDDIAETIQDPEHGEVLVAYVDAQALDGAPKLAAALALMERRSYEAVQARAAAADVWDRWSQPFEPPTDH
jgi:hypothetical protein